MMLIKIVLKKILLSFPINQKRIFFMSFDGKTITCNPYYIYNEFQKSANDYDIIWCCNKPEYKTLVAAANVRFVKFRSIAYYICLATSRIIINNSGVPFLIRPEKQIYIETWHGGGAYKRVGISEKGTIEREKTIKILGACVKFFISSSHKFSEIMSQSCCVPKEKFLNIGMPRNDIFFNSSIMMDVNMKIRTLYSIAEGCFIVLFAPTYRGDSFGNVSFKNSLNVVLLRKIIEEKFKKNVIFAFRGHYYFDKSDASCFDIDFSDYHNMQEILCTVDMLITDYSSSMWDFSFTGKPCLLYVPDLEKYTTTRGFYTPPETWGFPIATTNEELVECVKNFDIEDYKLKMEKHHKMLGSYESGTATKKIVEIIKTFL